MGTTTTQSVNLINNCFQTFYYSANTIYNFLFVIGKLRSFLSQWVQCYPKTTAINIYYHLCAIFLLTLTLSEKYFIWKNFCFLRTFLILRYLLLFLSTYNVLLWNNSLHVFFVLYYPKTILCISPSQTLIFRSFSQPLNLIDYNWIHTVQPVSLI